jgi:trimeric autotransporter adhesin
MARTSPWPTVLGTAALIALPVLAAAQSGAASSTGSQAPQTPKAQSDTRYPVGSGAATQHLTEAKMVLDGIPRNAVTGSNAAKINEIRREFAALQRSYEANPSVTPDAKSSRSSKGSAAHWNTQLMKLDRDLAALLGPGSEVAGTTGSTSTETETAGTSGSSSASRPTAGASATESASLDPNVKSQLEEFRKHITQFAAAASGTGAGGEMSSSESAGSPASTSATGSTATAGSTTPTEQAETTTSSSSSQSNPTSTSPQTGSATGEAAQTQASQPQTTTSNTQVDATAARQHLTEARQSLADLTALPQAQQLQGDVRTEVSQLISQFNQLITTQDDWRSAYEQVNNTLNTLLNSSGSSSSASQGSVGTSGSASASASATLDPAIRGKLEEFRTHLQAFHSAAGGEAAGASASPGASSAAGATGASADAAESHIADIERILDQAGAGSSSSASTSGTSGSTTGTATGSTSGTSTSGTPTASASSVTLTPQQIEQIRMHLQQLRTAIRK